MMKSSEEMQLLVKEAISRLDKEVAKGTVSYGDVVPGAVNKSQAQASLLAPPSTPARQVAQTRRLNRRLYKAQMANPTAVSGGLAGGAEALRKMSPVGPGMLEGSVFVPSSSGAFVRRAAGSKLDLARASLAPTLSLVQNRRANLAVTKLLGPRKPVDATLNRAVLHHELGEASLYRGLTTGTKITPAASHLGVTPIVRENLALVGDPEAQNIMAKLRARDPGDVTMQRTLRQVGATPGAPIPEGGRQHRAAERLLQERFNRDPRAIGAGRQLAARLNFMAPSSINYSVPGPTLEGLQTRHSEGLARFRKILTAPITPFDKTKALGRIALKEAPGLGKTLKEFYALSKWLKLK